MPFQPLSDGEAEKTSPIDFGLLFLRIAMAATFTYYQSIDQVGSLRAFVWDSESWDLAERFGELGLPFPGVLASVYIAVTTFVLVALTFGFLARINATILFLLVAFALVGPLELSASLNPQTLLLYIGISLSLIFGGAGRLSLDYLLAGRKARKKGLY